MAAQPTSGSRGGEEAASCPPSTLSSFKQPPAVSWTTAGHRFPSYISELNSPLCVQTTLIRSVAHLSSCSLRRFVLPFLITILLWRTTWPFCRGKQRRVMTGAIFAGVLRNQLEEWSLRMDPLPDFTDSAEIVEARILHGGPALTTRQNYPCRRKRGHWLYYLALGQSRLPDVLHSDANTPLTL